MGVQRERQDGTPLTIAERQSTNGEAMNAVSLNPLQGSALMARIAATLEQNLAECRDQFLARASRELDALDAVSRLELGRTVTLAAEALLRDALARLEAGTPPPLELPPAVVAAARSWARGGHEPSALIGACSVGDDYFWDQFERAADVIATDGGSALQVQRRAQRELAEYADRTQLLLRAAFGEGQSAAAADTDIRRSLLVRHVIDGGTPRPAELGYELAQHHLAVIAWDGSAAEAAAMLRERLGRNLLSCSMPDGALWAWIGSRRPLSPEDLLAIVEAADALSCPTALGEPGSDHDGFRRSHRQALLARDAASARPSPASVTCYSDVAVMALLASCDATPARELVNHELAGLLGADPRTDELRRTLRTHLMKAQRTSATGRAMGIDRHTVRERLDEIERRLGRPLDGRSTELAIALALHAAEQDGDASPGGGVRPAA
jgi:hypothetical protein